MQHTRSMSPRLLATLLVLVFAAGRSSAATCADGSSPGTNGCCAATNECPPCCIYAAVSNYGDSAECRCLFCDGATAKIDAACTSPPPPAGEVAVRSSCPAEYPTYAGGVLAQMFASIATTMEPSRGKNKPR